MPEIKLRKVLNRSSVKPEDIDISRQLVGSPLGKLEKEKVVCSIVKIGRQTGNEWPNFSWEEYKDLCGYETDSTDKVVLYHLSERGLLHFDGTFYSVKDELINLLFQFIK